MLKRVEPSDVGLGTLFYSARDAVVVGEIASGTIVAWNEAASALFGYSQEEAVGLLIEDLIPPALKSAHRAGLRRYLEKGRGSLIDSGTLVELPAICKDGTEIQVEFTLSPLESRVTGTPYAMAIIRDISERVKKDAEITELNNSLREFLGIAAHDMRTPLTVIQGMTALLKKNLSDDENCREMLGAIERQTERMTSLVADLLTTSRIDAAAIESRPEKVSVTGAATALVEGLGASSVEVSGRKDLTAFVDPQHLGRMLQNLLSNALMHGEPPVSLVVSEENGNVLITVRDAGKGVSPEVADRLFQKFARSEESRQRGGSGLGLSIVKGLAEVNGGKVSYPSDPTRFCLQLPRGRPVH